MLRPVLLSLFAVLHLFAPCPAQGDDDARADAVREFVRYFKKAKEEFVKSEVKRGWEHRENLEGSGKVEWPGLCGGCTKLQLVQTALGSKRAECGDGMFGRATLNPHDPVVKCTSFWPRGVQTLSEMAEQARYIVIAERLGQYL